MTQATSDAFGVEATEKGQRAVERLKETFGTDNVPAGISALSGSENGINDLYMNLKRQLEEGKVSRGDKFLVAIGVASAAGSADAVSFLSHAARNAGVDGQHAIDAVSVAAVCTIFNGYYSFRDLAEGEDFSAFRAPFNANTFMKSTLSTAQVEMICIAVSALNKCSMCVTGHMQKAKGAGVTLEQVDEVIKAAAAAQGFAAVANSLG